MKKRGLRGERPGRTLAGVYDVVHLRAARVAALAILLAAAGGCSLAAPKPVRDVPGGDPERERRARPCRRSA